MMSPECKLIEAVQGFKYIKFPAAERYEVFRQLDPEDESAGYLSCGVADCRMSKAILEYAPRGPRAWSNFKVDEAPYIPLFTINNVPFELLKHLIVAYIHIHAHHRGRQIGLLQKDHPDYSRDGFSFYFEGWQEQGNPDNEHTRVTLDFGTRPKERTDYQKAIATDKICLYYNKSKAPILYVGAPGIPLKVLNQLLSAFKGDRPKLSD